MFTAGLAAAVVFAVPAFAAQATGPGLVVDAGAQPPRPGQEFALRTTVTNGGGAPVTGALLAQHVPEVMEIVEVEGDGVVREGIVNWQVDVPAGEEAVYTVRVRAPEGEDARERLTSTACLLLERDSDPTACASDTVVPAEGTVMSRVSEYVEPAGLLRAAGVALVLGLVWILWRRVAVVRRG
ncbi:DUF4139 domain-containing protein [Nocardiopsis halotolerans]|uniref:DUF4139 domain-containing protein n=1 Tax=Nocardiopsis halotolerans TaxID=124252 RepID=UPI001F4CD345|nr:DUF4139 domain-containing protein [Nocardiopsis halotolerans]